MARAFTLTTRQRMSESAKARCTPEFRKRVSAIHSAKIDINEVERLIGTISLSNLERTQLRTAFRKEYGGEE